MNHSNSSQAVAPAALSAEIDAAIGLLRLLESSPASVRVAIAKTVLTWGRELRTVDRDELAQLIATERIRGDMASPQPSSYVGDVTCMDPDTQQPVDMEVHKDPRSGGLFAVDFSYIEQVSDCVYSPFTADGIALSQLRPARSEDVVVGGKVYWKDPAARLRMAGDGAASAPVPHCSGHYQVHGFASGLTRAQDADSIIYLRNAAGSWLEATLGELYAYERIERAAPAQADAECGRVREGSVV